MITTNSKGDDGYMNGKNANMGTSSDFHEVNDVKEGRSASIMDKWGANQMDNNSGSLNSNGKSKAVTIPIGHMIDNAYAGPIKPTPKWTKVPRMDYGLEGGCDTQTFPTLGKRGSAQIVGKDYIEKET